MHVLRAAPLLAVLASIALPGPPAGAQPPPAIYPVHVRISHREPFFHGSVASAGGTRCSSDRKVKLLEYRRRRARHPKLVGRGRTGAHGRWTIIDLSPRPGYWYRVRVARKVTPRGVCEAALSAPVQVV